ncbi:FxDxF family PEP-CTERM protein, partial [Nitrosomonas sp.]|uniref:FxDxF family PEP-CTERM protein n=1 Tax=Nitrosomonas sp. TaxID=42353 RepID=UPI0035B16444
TFRVRNDTPDLPVSGHTLISFETNPGPGSFQATFAGGASSVSIDVSDYSPSDDDEPSLYAYDAGGTLLDSDSIYIPDSGPGGTLSVSSLTPIAYVQWNEVGSFAGVVFWDNLVYAPVPEPETYAMLLAGLGLLGFAARRRKESAV